MTQHLEIFPQLLTVSEVAGIFRLTQAAIRRMVRAKEIPAIRIGKEYRIPKQVVHNILNPLTEQTLKEAGFGIWAHEKNPEGSKWLRSQRAKERRTLVEVIKEIEG